MVPGEDLIFASRVVLSSVLSHGKKPKGFYEVCLTKTLNPL
jgi:hypothetical protein